MSEQSPKPTEQDFNISESILETVQIGGIAGRDQNLTQIQGGVGTVNVFGLVKVDQAPTSTTKTLNQQEYRWRKVLLDKVQSFWIDGVLAKSLHTQVLIKLGLEERREFVQNQLSGVEEFPSDSVQVFADGTTAAEIFEKIGAGRTLLILGEPGCGKTVTLLKLAESLIARTKNDLRQLLPVVVNLSSWAKQRQSIADWLVQEIYEIYGASKSLTKIWVEQEQLILLLDGLDEVNAKYRNDCVKALNQFIQRHGLTEVVVCSRIRDYENLSERLKLRSAIYVQSLTSQQIDQFLERADESLFSLKTLLQNNTEIRAFASSPLILSIMSLAYQGCSLDTVQTISTANTFHQRLFDAYIKRMFMRRGTTQQFSQEQTKHWLIWMAKIMAQVSQTVFLIERMQPSWFQTRLQRIRYRLESALISGLILGLASELIAELIYGLIGGEGIERIAGQSVKLITGQRAKLAYGLSYGLFSGLAFGFLGNIKTVETLKWSWKEAKSTFHTGMIYGLIAGPITGLIYFWLFFWLFFWQIFWQIFWQMAGLVLITGLIYGLIGALIGALIGTLIGGFRGPEMQKKFEPNQGIWKSGRNALIYGLITGLIGAPIGALIYGLIYGLSVGLISALSFGLSFGLIGVLIGVLIGGGTTCLRHFILRLMLYRMGYIPWNYARFLDNAADHLFLQKVGGGYIFVHRMLLEHFAKMELEQKRR